MSALGQEMGTLRLVCAKWRESNATTALSAFISRGKKIFSLMHRYITHNFRLQLYKRRRKYFDINKIKFFLQGKIYFGKKCLDKKIYFILERYFYIFNRDPDSIFIYSQY